MAPSGLIEREAELARLDTVFEQVRAGSGGTVIVRGPPGIGKTRFLGELRARAEGARLVTLAATGGQLERDFPFGCVRQLFERLVLDPARREQMLEGDARLGKPVFRAPGEAGGATPDSGYGVLHGLYWLTANLAEQRPLLLALDDAHWADPPSLRYLSFLSRRLEGVPAVVALTMRPTEPGAPADLLRELTQGPATDVLDLGPLSAPATAELVRARVDEDVSERICALCHEASGGNPFLLGELLREAGSIGSDPAAPLSAERIEALGPERVADAVIGRIEATGAGALEMASAVALLGDGAELRAAAALAGTEEEAVARLADELGAIGVLEAERPLRFVHPIVRNAVYGRMPAAVRDRSHRRAAELLAETGGSAEAVAAHLLATEPGDRPELVDVMLEAAGDAGSRGAPDLALRYLERAVAEPPLDSLRPTVFSELGRSAALVGDPRALDWLRQAVELGGSSPAGVSATVALGRALTFAGRSDEALSVGQRLLTDAGGSGEPGRKLERWLLSLAQLSPSTRRPAEEIVRRNLEAAIAGEALSAGQLACAALEAALTEGDAGLAVDLAERAGRQRLSEQGRQESLEPGLTVATLLIAERFETGERLLNEILADARESGSIRLYAGAYSFRAWARYRQGLLAEVRADADLYPDFAQAAVTDLVLAGAHVQALVDAGELEQAAAVAAPVIALSLERELTIYQRFAEGLAALRLAQGNPRGALEVTEGMTSWEKGTGQRAGTWVAWRSQAALAHAALDEREQALTLAGEQVELARRFGAPGMLGSALRVKGLVSGGEEGIVLLEEAASTLEGSALRLEYARALIDLGAARRRAGRQTEARPELREGVELAHRCGAAAIANLALEELVAAGARPRRPAARDADALTPSERRVAGMAAEGMSNKQIAQSLFVTVRTVETHLWNAYRKLGIKSRSQLANALAE